MVPARLLLALLATLVLATTANASSSASATAPPTALRGFVFRADEPLRHEFARTPSFAWTPVRGAVKYEFELSTSNVFRENGIIFADRDLKSPVASVMMTLPWISGSPYSLYARARAVMRSGVTAWSKPFGFNMRQESVPRPLATKAGLLRWTPIEGASGYEVWLIDANRHIFSRTNVLDEREFYTFHQSDPWISNVRWRIRASRLGISPLAAASGGTNGPPAASFGPWSPVYETKNPPFATGPLRLVGTLSDVSGTGLSSDPGHRLMPAFLFAGNQTIDGVEAELFRVYVFTDRDCINPVFVGSVVGSPAYTPRPFGPLGLPDSSEAITTMRGAYGSEGDQDATFTYDDEQLTPTESLSKATPTTALPAGASTPPASGSGSTPTTPTAGTVTFLTVTGDFGAPIELWDTGWPEGGYYWTVVPVAATSSSAAATTLANGSSSGATTVDVLNSVGFAVGDVIQIGIGATKEVATITAINGNTFTLGGALGSAHSMLEQVSRASGNIRYQDLELPQEACAHGRVMRFGKSSEPSLVASGTPFASGLSPKGRLTSATSAATKFYGSPLVAWTPALGADAYHLQWSKTRAPFRPVEANWEGKGIAAGLLTFATSAVLPLKPGTWWYRVRGVSFSLPTDAQYMSWSDPTRIVMSKPTFSVAKPKKK